MSAPFVRPPAAGSTPEVLQIFTDQVTIKLSSAETGGTYPMLTGLTPPHGGPPLHKHLSDSETFYVLSGEFVFELDGVIHQAGPGSTVHIPAGVTHLYQCVSEEPGEVLLVVQPGGLDDFFIELDALLKAHSEPPMPAIAALHEKFGMELMGPPLAAR